MEQPLRLTPEPGNVAEQGTSVRRSDANCSGSLRPCTHVGLDQYLLGACAEKKVVLIDQDKQAREDHSITCGCGWKLWIGYAYRCLYCGEWYCAPCAETHFGQSMQAWTIEKRIAKRLEIEARILGQNAIERAPGLIERAQELEKLAASYRESILHNAELRDRSGSGTPPQNKPS